MKVATSAQMRAMDKETTEKYGVPAVVLMENAAIRVVDEMERRWAPLAGKRITVVCGKGNNGGDGLAIARHLTSRCEASVVVWLTQAIESGSAELIANRDMAMAYGLTLLQIDDLDCMHAGLASSDIIVDAILGTGALGAPRPEAARAICAINDSGKPVIAVDIPSGVSADTGDAAEPAVKATVTVTFALSKPGLHVLPGAAYAGQVVVGDIGFPRELYCDPTLNITVTDAREVAQWLPSRGATRDTNKGKFGGVLVLAGSSGYAGAACLSAHGASRAGAGLVTLGVPKSIFEIIMARTLETVMTRPFADTSGGSFSPAALKAALTLCEKMDTVAIGPGLSSADAGAREFVHRFLRECPLPVVVDADALNALAILPDHGASILTGRKAPTLITPHPGELGRLLGRETAVVQADRFRALRDAVDAFGCVVLLKGSRTAIGAPDGRIAINETGNPGMATGGMGDVLTGVAAAFLAQIPDPFQAAAAAAYIHGAAGDLAAAKLGPAGILATDVAEFLPQAMRRAPTS